ncbi:MAG: DNA helicase [Alkalinema sp. CACIAM 70d]|nr:MAG: DNA helicase [Alkalinema sp. CACIAM 70d]
MSLQANIRLAISDKFFDSYSRLPKNAQNKVSEFINRFRQNPTSPGLNYEVIRDSRDKNLRSVRVDQGHRAIVLKPQEGNVYVLLWVDKHDDAYSWAKRQVCVVNQISGALQIIDASEVEIATQQIAAQVSPQVAAQPESGRFHKFSDDELMRLGVPQILLGAVRQVVSDEQVDQLLPHLPAEASDALLLAAADYGYEEILAQLDKSEASQGVDPEDLATALQNEDSLSRFLILTDDTDLEEMLAAPLEKWRVFLHPTQRKLIERDWAGAVRVLGGAGTGKTVVAMHRAKWLLQNRFQENTDRILFTTFTKNLAVDITANLQAICSIDMMKRIHVINLDAWVADFLRKEGVETKIVYAQDTEGLWEKAYACASQELDLDLSFYKEEWREVVLNQDCQNQRDYLTARRIGRGTRLSRIQRQDIWLVFEEYRNLLRERGWREPDEAMRDAAKIIQARGSISLPYKAVIVDEAQDMSDSAFTLLRAIAGESKPNDLFIVGDAHQRIYSKTTILSRCNINVKGRSKKLRLNYRTTDEIRQWATAILNGTTIDDLDGGTDDLRDYRSLMHGEAPIIKGFSKPEQELDYLNNVLKDLEQQTTGVCLVFRTDALLQRYETQLKALHFTTRQIRRNTADNPSQQGIRLATMHRIKGLQFDYIVIPGLSVDVLPLKAAIEYCADETSRTQALTAERSLLHVAATRAKRQVFITYTGSPSTLLP